MVQMWMIEKARLENTNTLKNWIWSAVSQCQPIPSCMSVASQRYVLRERGEDDRGYHDT